MNDAAARTHQALIDELWDFDDPATSADRFRQAADSATDAVTRAVLATQVVRALGLLGRFEEAIARLDRIDTDGGQIAIHRGPSLESEVVVRVGLERGRIENSRGDRTASRPHFETALSLAQADGLENLAIDALHMIAIVAPVSEQAVLHDEAIAMAERADDPRARQWLASLLNNAGWTRFDGGDAAGALQLFERALEERVRQGKAREIGIARWSVARVMRELGRVSEALAIQRELLAANEAVGVTDPYVQEEIDECLRALAMADAGADALERPGADSDHDDPRRP